MQVYTATEARKQFFQILKEQKLPVEIRHPQNTVVMIAKEEFEKMEKWMIMKEVEEALKEAKGQKRYSTEEVGALMAEILEEDLDG